jgi:glycosyltransferase involved in cell wall biosynthesis
MRVLVNGLSAAGARTGIGHYTAELLRCLDAQTVPGEVVRFPGPWLCRARAVAGWARTVLSRGRQPAAAEAGPPTLRGRAAACVRAGIDKLLRRSFRAACRRKRIDLYHEPNFIPLPADVPTIATFADLSLLHPEWHPAYRVRHFERRLRQALAQCCHILAISEFVRREIIDVLGLPPQRVTRTYMGVRPGLGPLPAERVRRNLVRLGLSPGYLLYVGTIEPRKNVPTLLRAYCTLPAAVRERHPLVLVGGWGWGVADVAAYLRDEARHRGVVHLGYVPDALLPALYNGARALAYPSWYEGFGLPPVEMLACGGAVLASTAGAVAETVGGQAHLMDPADLAGWRDALRRVCTDDDWWNELRRGAAAAAAGFTWERCAADTLHVYRTLVGRPQTRELPPPRRAAG